MDVCFGSDVAAEHAEEQEEESDEGEEGGDEYAGEFSVEDVIEENLALRDRCAELVALCTQQRAALAAAKATPTAPAPAPAPAAAVAAKKEVDALRRELSEVTARLTAAEALRPELETLVRENGQLKDQVSELNGEVLQVWPVRIKLNDARKRAGQAGEWPGWLPSSLRIPHLLFAVACR